MSTADDYERSHLRTCDHLRLYEPAGNLPTRTARHPFADATVKETSYYGPLANLLNATGATLKPKVRCVGHIKNQGAGIPDGGLFTAEQAQKSDEELLTGGLPARGVIEVKGTGEEVAIIAAGAQIAKYLQNIGRRLSPTIGILR